MKKNRTIIFGARSYIGKFLCDYLEKCNFEVIRSSSAECDLLSSESLNNFLDGVPKKSHTIIFLATINQFEAESIIGFEKNIRILKNFVEAVIAPDYEKEALKLFAGKKNIRIMKMPAETSVAGSRVLDLKRVSGGLLIQDKDVISHDPSTLRVVTKKQPGAREMDDLLFAWVVAKHVKSNAIVYARSGEALGIGAGQMSRVDSARLAVEKARRPLKDCVMASDAFFPFRDSVDTAAKSGVSAIIQPGGSIRDEEVIQAADEHGMSMVFTSIRHFKH